MSGQSVCQSPTVLGHKDEFVQQGDGRYFFPVVEARVNLALPFLDKCTCGEMGCRHTRIAEVLAILVRIDADELQSGRHREEASYELNDLLLGRDYRFGTVTARIERVSDVFFCAKCEQWRMSDDGDCYCPSHGRR